MTDQLESMLKWIDIQTPITQRAMERHKHKRFKDISLAYIGHIEPKMIRHLLFLKELGVTLLIAPCVPGISDNRSFDYLRSQGMLMFGDNANDAISLKQSWKIISDCKPQYVFEMGGKFLRDAILLGYSFKAACEATGSGVDLLQPSSPSFPIFNIDDMPIKKLMHNRYEVGNAAWFTFREITGLDVCRQNVGILGFGPVGQGMAWAARGLGARVWICEEDDVRFTAAASEGFNTGSMREIISQLDIVITATGQRDALHSLNLFNAKDGLIIGNVGHDAHEVNFSEFTYVKEILPNLKEYKLQNKRIYILADGRLLNLASGRGSAINTFDVFTALSIESIIYMLEHGEKANPGLQLLPEEVSKNVKL